VCVLTIDNSTSAGIGAETHASAGGDVFVNATDDTEVDIISGAVAGGLFGVGGSVGVLTIDKTTTASIDGAVDALGAGTGIPGVLDGTITGDGTGFGIVEDQAAGEEAHGVIVQAQSSEDIFHLALAGSGGLFGVSGAVTVTLIDSDTNALIGGTAQINQTDDNADAEGNQSVFVGASNEVRVTSFAVAAAVGLVGVGGGVDVGSIKNDTGAKILNGAYVSAKKDVEVNALGIKELDGFTFSGGVGLVGMNASVSVWSVGTPIQKNYSDSEGDTMSAVEGESGYTADSDAAEKAENAHTEVTGQLNDGFASDGNPGSNAQLLDSFTSAAADRISSDEHTPTQATITADINSTAPTLGTEAVIEAGTVVDAGEDIEVFANEDMEVDMIVGGFSAGLVGTGASVSVLDLSGQVRASAGGNLNAQGSLKVEAEFDQDVDITAVAMQVGFVGLGAAVVVVDDTSAVQARLFDGTIVDSAPTVSITATNVQFFDVETLGIQAGLLAAGASFTDINVGNDDPGTIETLAHVGAGSQIGQTTEIGTMTISANSQIDATATTNAIAGGIGAGTFNFAFVDVTPNVEASVGDNANIAGTGLLTLETITMHDGKGDVFGLSIGLLAGGTSKATVTVSPTLTTSIGSNPTIAMGGISMLASHNFYGESATDCGARAMTEASGGGLFSGQGSVPTASANANASATIGSGGSLTIDDDIVMKSRVRNFANADTDVNSFGAAAVGASLAEATANGTISASMNANVADVRDITIETLAVNAANANAEAAAGGLLAAVSVNSASATASPVVRSSISNNTTIETSRNIRLEAESNTEGDSRVVGVTIGGLLSAGDSDAGTNVNPTVSSTIGAGSVINATGDVTVKAIATPVDQTPPDFSIQGVDGVNNTITVNRHGLSTGETVEYDAGSLSAVIAGLDWPITETQFDENDDEITVEVNRQYNVINVYDGNGDLDPNKLYFGSTFNPANIDPNTEIITFNGAHNFVSGDAVRYFPGPGETISSFGLTQGALYYVLVLDASSIKLVDSLDKAQNPDDYFMDFAPTSVSGSAIPISGSHTFAENDAVTYDSPDPKTFSSTQVDVNIGSGPGGTVSFSDNSSANNIHFVDENGMSAPHGFLGAELVRYSVESSDANPAVEIGGLHSGRDYRVVYVDANTIKLKRNDVVTNLQVEYFRDASGFVHLIRTDDQDWSVDGFGQDAAEGEAIIISNSDHDGTYSIVSASGDTLTLGEVSGIKATRFIADIDFDPAVEPDGLNDTITRLDGRTWAQDGFGPGTFTINGTSYTVVSVVDADTLELNTRTTNDVTLTDATVERAPVSDAFDEPVIELAPYKTPPPPTTTNAPRPHDARADIQSLIRVADLPIGPLVDGNTYYVTNVGGGKFQLKATPSAGSAITLTPTSEPGPYNSHRIGALAVDISAASPSEQQLRIDIDDTETSADSGQYLFGPGGVSLSEIAPQSGDGVSSVYSKGSGGGFIGVGKNDADIYSNPSATATISSALLSASGDVTVMTLAETDTTSYAVNGTGGFVGVGDADSRSRQNITSAASIGDNARVLAGKNFAIDADTNANTRASSRSSAGGAVGLADAVTDVNLYFNTTATIGTGAVVLAGELAKITADSEAGASAKSSGTGVGLGGDAEAQSSVDMGPADTIVTLGSDAILSSNRALLSAKVNRLDILADSDGRGGGFYAEGSGDSDVITADLEAVVNINAGAELIGFEGVDLITCYDNVDTFAKAFSRATGLFGHVDSDAHNDTNLSSEILGTAGALVTAGPRDPGDTVLGHPDKSGIPTGVDEHLALYATTENGPNLSQDHRARHSKRSLAGGGSSGSSPDDRPSEIDFSSDVLILSGRSPELLVKTLDVGPNGTIEKAVEVTVDGNGDGTGAAIGQGDTITSEDIFVNDITNPGPGDVVFFSDTITNTGAEGTWTFRETLQRVDITNESHKDIIINDIAVVDGDQPLVWLNPSINRTIEFNIVHEVAPTLIEITNEGNADIHLNGKIDNPIGTTSILNVNGSVFATMDRDLDPDSTNPQSLIRTHILRIEASESVGSDPDSDPPGHRVNVDIVDSAGLPEDALFDTGRVSGLSDEIFLGQENRFFTGQLVQYHASSTEIGGLTDGDYYYAIVSSDKLRVQLAASLADALEGTEIDLTPGGSLTDEHTLTAAETFTVDADDNIYLDLKGLLREDASPYIIEIDRISAGDTADVLLQASVEQFGDGLTGGVLVKFINATDGETHYTFFDQPDGEQPRSRGVFATGNTELDSTYDFRGINPVNGARELAGLVSGLDTITGDIKVVAAESDPSDTTINVLGITEVTRSGEEVGEGHMTVLTNGWIALTEKTGDMRVESITSTADDVLLYSPKRILDADGDVNTESDVAGVSISMISASRFVNPDADEIKGATGEVQYPTLAFGGLTPGGIGLPNNFLEINVDRLNQNTGVLRAYDMAPVAHTLGIYLDEMSGALRIHTVLTSRDVSLRTVGGSIVDARDDIAANIYGQTIDLDANGAGSDIGEVDNDLEINSRIWSPENADDVGLEATGNIYLAETYGNLRLVLAHTYDGDIRLTVRESSASVVEDFELLASGQALFAEANGATRPGNHDDSPRNVPHGQIFAEDGSVLLRVGDDIDLHQNSEILAAEGIDIFGDIFARDDNVFALANLDPNYGTNMVLRGRIIANADVTPGSQVDGNPVGTAMPTITGPEFLTRIWGNTDVDTIQFGDPTGIAGGTGQGDPGYIYLGSKTRAYGSQDLDPNHADGEDRFIVYYLQDTNTQTSPAMQTVAEHTLTLDGVSESDDYKIYTLGSNSGIFDNERNTIINVLDSGLSNDGVDELTIFGYDSSLNGDNQPTDDVFLLRSASFLPNETADRPAYVAMLYGQPDTYLDTIEGNEPSNEVLRVNYDTALNGRISILGMGGNDAFYSDDTSVIVSLQGGAGDDSFQIGQIFGYKRTDLPTEGNLLAQDVFPDMVATTRGWLSPGISAPLVAQGGTGDDKFQVYSNQSELRLEGDDDNDLFIIRAFAIAAVANQDWNGDGIIDADDLPAVDEDTNGDGVINFADADSTPDDWTDDTIVLDEEGVAQPIIGLGFSVARAPDIRCGGGEDEVQYNVNAPVSVDGGTGFDKLVILATEFADDIAITESGIFGAGLNVRYSTIEVVEVDGLEGDDEFFVQSTAFGVAYRVIGGLGSDTINVTGDVTEDIVTRELEGAMGAVDHLVTSDDLSYEGVLVDGFNYNVATAEEGIVIIHESGGFTAVREGGPVTIDSYTVKLAVQPLPGQMIYVTASAARSPQEEADNTLIHEEPYLPNGEGDTIWLSTDPPNNPQFPAFQRDIIVNGIPDVINNRAVVLTFDHDNWDQEQTVYVFAPDDPRAEGDRVVVSQHTVISDIIGVAPVDYVDPFDAADVRNVEVMVRDNDTPGVYVTEVEPGTSTEDMRTLVIEGDSTTQLTDEILVQLAKEPANDVVVRLFLDEDSNEDIALFDVDDPDNLNDRMFKGDDGYWRIQFNTTTWLWDDPVRVGVQARDDATREDPATAVISFERDDLTLDANYIFPNLRSGPGLQDVEVIDNETAGAVVLQSEGKTLLNADGTDTDDYTLRLTKEPEADVQVAILTDGLADVVEINGNPVAPADYAIVGGLRPIEIFEGSLIFENVSGFGQITRGTGADLGSFISEGFTVGQNIRIGGSGVDYDGDYFITFVDHQIMTVDSAFGVAGPVEVLDTATLSDLADIGIFTGEVEFKIVPEMVEGIMVNTYRMTITGLADEDPGWLAARFLEGQRIRIIDGSNAGDYKIAIIRGENDTKDDTIQFTVENTASFDEGIATVTVVRTAAVATFDLSNYYTPQTIELRADVNYQVPITREGVKVFPVEGHYLSKLRGPLAVEGGPTGADRSLQNGLKLPGEADDFLIAIGAQPPESQQIDVLNIFNDTSKEDVNGTMTQTTLRGFNMAEDLDFGALGAGVFGESGFYPGGISFGKISFGEGGFGTDAAQSTIEVLNLMLGEGNDRLDIEGTLDPAPSVQVTNNFEFNPDAGGNGGTIVREGFDWKAQGFLVGQTVIIEGQVGIWTVAAIDDAIPPGETLPDPNDNSILVLSGPVVPDIDGVQTITASDKDVITTNVVVDVVETTAGGIVTRTDLNGSWIADGFAVGEQVEIEGDFNRDKYLITELTEKQMTLVGKQLAPVSDAIRTINQVDSTVTTTTKVTVDPSYVGGIVTRESGGDTWIDEGYIKGHLVTMVDENGKRDFRINEISEDELSLILEGVALPDETGVTKSFYVQGVHGGLTVVHGGGNFALETEGDMNVDSTHEDGFAVTRLDGRAWVKDRYEIHQIVQLAGETYTREILDIVDTTIEPPENAAQTWGDGSTLILSEPLGTGGDVLADGDYLGEEGNALALHVTEPLKTETTQVMNIATSSLTRSAGNWTGAGFYVGQKVYISEFAGPFTVETLDGPEMTLQGVALTPQTDVELTVFGFDKTLDGGVHMGGDYIVISGGAGPNSPLVVYGDTSQDGMWYSGEPYSVLGLELGEKPFDPFPQLTDEENEDDEWVFPLANPFDFHGNDVIDASALFAETQAGSLPSIGFTAYGGPGNDTIIGSQAGDHLAGGSGDDTIYGQRGVDHIYGDSGVNVNVFTRALTISTIDASPLPTAEPGTETKGTTIKPVKSPLRDDLDAGRDVIYGDGPGSVEGMLGDFDDIIFGDHGEIVQNVDDPNLPSLLLQKIQTTTLDSVLAINSVELQNGDDDVIFGNLDRDIIVGGAGNDMADGDEQDDLIFGDNVFLERRDLQGLNPADGDLFDDITNPRFQTLLGELLYSRSDQDPDFAGAPAPFADDSGELLIDDIARKYRDPDGAPWWAEYLIEYSSQHNFEFDEGEAGVGSFGNDYLAGGEAHDEIFGQLGDDVIQGDGGIEDAFAADSHAGASRTPDDPMGTVYDFVGDLDVVPSFEASSDGEDYIEGGGGSDVIFGGLGQDDIVGGSSSFFSLGDPTNPLAPNPEYDPVTNPDVPEFLETTVGANLRPDGDDIIFGGAGTQVARNNYTLDVVVFTETNGGELDTDEIQTITVNTVGGFYTLVFDGETTSEIAYNASAEELQDALEALESIGEGNVGVDKLDSVYRVTFQGDLAGEDVAELQVGGVDEIHARDADTIAGDNANIVRIVGTSGVDVNLDPVYNPNDPLYVNFNYDNYGNERIIVRGVELLDYTPGGPAFHPDLFSLTDPTLDTNPGNDGFRDEFGIWARYDIGGHDEVHGETGDDTVYTAGGHDRIFGDAEDDDLIGGWGNDWVSGGTGQDGVIGDDGRIFTSRNTGGDITDFSEPLYGIHFLLAEDPDPRHPQVIHGNVINEFVYTPGQVQTVTLNVNRALNKAVDITPFNLKPNAQGADDPLFDANMVDDVIFGGLGDDFLHGASGDDAIAGGEALEESYTQLFDAGGNVIGLVRTDFTRPWNPGDILKFGDDTNAWNAPKPVQSRLGEFFLYDEYDPRRTIMFYDNGEVWKTGGAPEYPYFLNQRSDEGPSELGAVAFAPNGTPIEFDYAHNDGADVMFGDLGNDWLVGGTGKDTMWGGWGNDLMNADDVLTITGEGDFGDANLKKIQPSPNDEPDTHPLYEDRVYGGAGLDILIGNTGGDRLIDWVGEYNSYIVPFAPFGIATVSRQVPPALFDFLYALSASQGADPTRDTDTGNDAERNGEPDGELGLIIQRDHGLWQDQTGGPTDPQPGNIPGGRRDVLRTADFNDGSTQGFFIDSGVWTVSGGRLQIAPVALGEDAVSVFYPDVYLPNYFELKATINAGKPTAGTKSNAYLIFDYQGPEDFKFAGLDVAINKMVMGHRDASGWHVDEQAPVQGGVKAERDYTMLLALNGTVATLVVDNKLVFTHVYTPRVDEYGYSYGLNAGLVGIGANNSIARIDNVAVQVLPPDWTYENTEDFGSTAVSFNPLDGDWEVLGGRYEGAPAAGDLALSLYDLKVSAESVLELGARFRTETMGGIVFDVYGPEDFKFVAISAVSDEVLIGHHTARGGWQVDGSVARNIESGSEYDLGLSLRGLTVSVTLNGQAVIGYAFNGLLVDGGFGVLCKGGASSFDSFAVKSNDPALAQNLMASTAPSVPVEVEGFVTYYDELAPIVEEAIARWSKALGNNDSLVTSLYNVSFQIVDFNDLTLGRAIGDTVLIDVDAAGYGWFVDATPYDDVEFSLKISDEELLATGTSEAYGHMDLLTVVMHELGHILGFEDLDPDAQTLMSGTLDAGERHTVGDTDNQVQDDSVSSLVAMDEAKGQFSTEESIRSQNSWLHSWLMSNAVYDQNDPNRDIKIFVPKDKSKDNPHLRRFYGKGKRT
jgi:hypothetical protein